MIDIFSKYASVIPIASKDTPDFGWYDGRISKSGR
jgi:hypothetical protein